jgi:hypothetical protein
VFNHKYVKIKNNCGRRKVSNIYSLLSIKTLIFTAIPCTNVMFVCVCIYIKNGKAVPLQAWSGPEGSRKLRFSDFMITAQDGGKVSVTHWPPLPPGNNLLLTSVRS